MKRLWTFLAALGLALGVGLIAWGPTGVARADSGDQSIRNYVVQATAHDNGWTDVRLTVDFDFGSSGAHGPHITLPLRQAIDKDPNHWWKMDVKFGGVTSPSGANTAVQTTTKNGNLVVRVGSESRRFTGVQKYVVTYSIHGIISGRNAESGLDEFNWTAVGTGWDVPTDNVSVTVTGPATIQKAACWTGSQFNRACSSATVSTSDPRTATFTARDVGDGKPLQVAAGFPAGTFANVEPVLEKRYSVGTMFPATTPTLAATGIATILALALVLRRATRSRDDVYVGLTPGLTPGAGEQVGVAPAKGKTPVTVQFQPPAGVRPGEIGVLIDRVADNRDVSATVIDLAVRGHLRINQEGNKEWTFTKLRSPQPSPLVDYEQKLVSGLFKAGDSVTTQDLKDEAYSGLLGKVRGKMTNRVTYDLDWFKTSPSRARVGAVSAGVLLILVGIGVGLGFGLFGFGLVGLALVIAGIVVMVLRSRFGGGRTAQGSAILAQAKGFEMYLTTAEADQIRFEEGVDVFSKYLPYAMVFGVADRWAKIFKQLADEGRYTPMNAGWYVGPYQWAYLGANFTSSIDNLADSISSQLQAATVSSAATSGSSAFGGGGGGGGFGGGGGGSW